jgi:hypothetical protein
MEKGYVYVARIIDHAGKFVNGYHKIGLSKQYKVRETQLNSTNLPFDVLMVRVFECEKMQKIESLLHLCFEDYRVVKEYDYRRNITTEWFDVSDIEIFNQRIDKFKNLLNLNEVDIRELIDKDTSLNAQEKIEAKNKVDNGKNFKTTLRIGDEFYENETQKVLMAKAYEHIISKVGTEKVANFDSYFTLNLKDFTKYCESFGIQDLNNTPSVSRIAGGFLWTSLDGKSKKRHIDKMCVEFGIEGLKFEIV